MLGLSCLALPLLASLQFYAGYPLRAITAEASRWLLQGLGLAVERSGASLLVDGRLVLVDAPCSGVQLLWFAYCAASAAALWQGVPRRGASCARLPAVGSQVLAATCCATPCSSRSKASGMLAWPGWTHDATGLSCWLPCARIVAFA